MKTILLVEDDDTLSQMMTSYLQENGFHAIPAGKYEEAVAALKHFSPDLIFLDYIGEQESRHFCSIARTLNPSAWIVLFTARCKPEEIAGRLGLEELLRKPFLLEELDVILGRLQAIENAEAG